MASMISSPCLNARPAIALHALKPLHPCVTIQWSKTNRFGSHVSSAAPTEVPISSMPPSTVLKSKLLAAIAGLDRGLIANETDLENVESAAKDLEGSVGTVDLSLDMEKLQGKWRLVYSSGFSSRSIGGFRPGPPVGRLPLTLGQVFQRIDVSDKELDNIVNLQIGAPWPLPDIQISATLAHTLNVIGASSIKITFQRTTVQPTGNLSQIVQSPIELPQLPEFLRPSSEARSGKFDVTFIDEDLRITRGDRGELRVFLKL